MKEKCSSVYFSRLCKWFIHIQESSVMFFCSYSEKYTLWVDEFRSRVTVSAHSFIIQSINTTVCQCECEGMSMFWQSNLFNTNHKLLLKKQNNLLKHVDINSTWHILNMSGCKAQDRLPSSLPRGSNPTTVFQTLGQEDASTDVQVFLRINAKRTLRLYLITLCSGDYKKMQQMEIPALKWFQKNPPGTTSSGEPLQ